MFFCHFLYSQIDSFFSFAKDRFCTLELLKNSIMAIIKTATVSIKQEIDGRIHF
ncbi:hypothetical protein LEP1GSC172_2582 [Leptospira noguchii]|uniref:Uncharacterized protein n=1 Tax=Leptospira noguchii TaxID=28182 RepID=M6VQF3_9LEPT|nr:hypothetical protein LEP1GSC172_2582 [Leptospira noguchii]